ncbi:MAG: archaetidylserine decarboxylase [Myxococcales bacterium]
MPRKQLSRVAGRIALLQSPSAAVNAAVAMYVRAYGVDMTEVQVPPDGFRSFDEFFTRRLEPGARTLDPDPNALVSPADGTIEGVGRLTPNAELVVKGTRYTASSLLDGPGEAARYRGGHYLVIYLSPGDYHRVHAPTRGAVKRVGYVPGTLFPVNRIGSRHVSQLLARNERITVLQQSEHHGAVTTILVGAMGVGRVTLCFDDLATNVGFTSQTRYYADRPITIDRGEELGIFHLGSTVIVMTTTECVLDGHLEVGSKVRMGQTIGRAGRAPSVD